MTRVALIGLGEVGRTFAEDLRGAGIADLTAWDTAFTEPGSAATAQRQRWAARYPQAVPAGSTIALLDAILSANGTDSEATT